MHVFMTSLIRQSLCASPCRRVLRVMRDFVESDVFVARQFVELDVFVARQFVESDVLDAQQFVDSDVFVSVACSFSLLVTLSA